MGDHLVFFKGQTNGPDHHQDLLLEAAFVAVDVRTFEPQGELDVKIQHVDRHSGEPLMITFAEGWQTEYDSEVWKTFGLHPQAAANTIAQFLHAHASVERVSAKDPERKPFKLARIAGHNVGRFDMPFLKRLFERARIFLPADHIALDTMQLYPWTRRSRMFGREPNYSLDRLIGAAYKPPTPAAECCPTLNRAHQSAVLARILLAEIGQAA